MNKTIEYDGVKYEMNITECKKTQLPHVFDEANKALALRLYSEGYQAGYSDTVEGKFTDDPRGDEAEHYHGERVSEIIEDHTKEENQ